MWSLSLISIRSRKGVKRFLNGLWSHALSICDDARLFYCSEQNPKIFPQNWSLFALIGHSQIKDGFLNPSFNNPFHLVGCSNRRNVAGLFSAKNPSWNLNRPHSTISFHKKYLSPHMLSALIDIFTWQFGLVIDPFSGKMPTAIARMQANRKFVFIELEIDCYQSAVHFKLFPVIMS